MVTDSQPTRQPHNHKTSEKSILRHKTPKNVIGLETWAHGLRSMRKNISNININQQHKACKCNECHVSFSFGIRVVIAICIQGSVAHSPLRPLIAIQQLPCRVGRLCRIWLAILWVIIIASLLSYVLGTVLSFQNSLEA